MRLQKSGTKAALLLPTAGLGSVREDDLEAIPQRLTRCFDWMRAVQRHFYL
jgi:hypothetical protein